ncbi:MAG: DoxX family membrane protein [Bacteroidetes bacterium]|nr:DoxX family membrane protein [Bacteroidota bacterium]
MEAITQYHYIAAACIARVFLGCLFFFQGYDAVFKVRVENVIEVFEEDFAQKGIPRFLTVCASWFTSYTELIGGFLLIMGLFEYAALYLLGINLIVAAIGFGINTPVWDTRFVFPRLILILLLLLIPHDWNSLSLDQLFFKP